MIILLVNFIKTWFLDEETMMNPNVKYAQLARGPDGQVGQHTGVLYVSFSRYLYPRVLISFL